MLCNVRKHALLGGLGACTPRKIFEFRTSEIASVGFSGQASVAKNNTHLHIQEALPLLFSSNESLFRSHVDSFACGANLKLRQANARPQAKVARACARVCRGSATPLFCPPTRLLIVQCRLKKKLLNILTQSP